MTNKNYKEKLYTALKVIKFIFFGLIGKKKYPTRGAIDLTFIGMFLLVSITAIILLNMSYLLIIPTFFVFSLMRMLWDVIMWVA